MSQLNWQEEYNKKLVSPEKAVEAIKRGDRVFFSGPGAEPREICQAMVDNRHQLGHVEIHFLSPRREIFWSFEKWQDYFSVAVNMVTPVTRALSNEHRIDIQVLPFLMIGKPEREECLRTDVFITEISPPDSHGFCSFGASLFDRKEQIKSARTVIAQQNEALIRTYGENYIHVSEIDYLVKASPRIQRDPPHPEVDEITRTIAGYVSSVIRNGDTIQVGGGTLPDALPAAGAFQDKSDLGLHTEVAVYGIIQMVKDGLITGKYKNINRGKAVATSLTGTAGDLEFVNQNPLFELYSSYYTHNISVIAAHDNMVAINGTLSVDLTGQIASESIGRVPYSTSGGQPAFAIGALASKGGRFILVLPSTAAGGKISRIVPAFEPGTIVTLPRTAADYIVTEYGIARLFNKTQRERALELIAIAHPDFRAELKQEAQKLYWP